MNRDGESLRKPYEWPGAAGRRGGRGTLLSGRACASSGSFRAGRVSPDGHWYDQDGDEWVLVVKGRARLRIDGEAQTGNSARATTCSFRPIAAIASPGPKRAAHGVAGDPHVHQMLTGTAESDETAPLM